MQLRALALALAVSTSLAGCASAPRQYHAIHANDLGGLIYEATDKVIDTATSSAGVSSDKPILVATSVNVDDLNASSTFGRLASQLVASRLAQRGYVVRDVTYTRGLVVTPETGEMVLSREATRIAAENNAQAVIAGAYAVGGTRIYLNIRLLGAVDGRVISSADLSIPLNEDTQRLIVTGQNGMERHAALDH